MERFMPNTIVAVSWRALGERRNVLRVSYYADLIAVDPSFQLIFTPEDADKYSAMFLDKIDALTSGTLEVDQLSEIGHRMYRLGFLQERVAQFTEILLNSIKDIHGQDWTPEIEEAWAELLGRAATIVHMSDRRRRKVIDIGPQRYGD